MSGSQAPGGSRAFSTETQWVRYSLVVEWVDVFTGGLPLERPVPQLEREDPPGTWTPVEPVAVMTPSGRTCFSGLEPRSSAAGRVAPLTYRLGVESPLYLPAFLGTKDFERVRIAPADNAGGAPAPLSDCVRIELLPSPAYPFPPHVPVARGTVRSASGAPVRNARIREGTRELALTDGRGCFALPLRWASPGVPTPLSIEDRQGRTAELSVTLPGALASAIDVQLP